MTYPDGREINYDYGTADAIDDIMSRLASIKDDDDSTVLASYRYLGAGRIVTEDYEEIQVNLDYAGDTNTFSALDRFGRVTDQVWNDYQPDPDVPLDAFSYGYDRVGNRVWKENVGAAEIPATPVHLDELYDYDLVNQLSGVERGNLVDGRTGRKSTERRRLRRIGTSTPWVTGARSTTTGRRRRGRWMRRTRSRKSTALPTTSTTTRPGI